MLVRARGGAAARLRDQVLRDETIAPELHIPSTTYGLPYFGHEDNPNTS